MLEQKWLRSGRDFGQREEIFLQRQLIDSFEVFLVKTANDGKIAANEEEI